MEDIDADLEEMVDCGGLSEILDRLSDICYTKAAHLSENWQDEPSAKLWASDARTIDKIIAKLNN